MAPRFRLRRLAALRPSRWPVRWRLTAVSSILTFLILVSFALVVGRLVHDRLRNDFREELSSTATELAFQLQVRCSMAGDCTIPKPDLSGVGIAADTAVRIVQGNGELIGATPGAPDLGAPEAGDTGFGDFEVATRPVVTNLLGAPPVYVQYAQDHDELDATISRLWFLLICGVIVGTLLATLAGLAVASRAMRPIAGLTSAAREIASTRDPSRRIPEPAADDEVGELARTLEQMLRELDASRSETQGMIQAQRDFVADASHELRTPLTSILANLELLQLRVDRLDGDQESAEIVGSALRSSRRMRRLVSDLLLLARADAGRAGLRTRCELTEIVAAAIAEVSPVAGDRRIEFDHDDRVELDGNPDELHRLAVNLIDNGVRHTPAGTTINVSVERRRDACVLIVSDDGPGLGADETEHLFSRFVRGDGPADVAVDGGTGLGLAIVRAVADAHGGTVMAGSSRSGGARFVVKLGSVRGAAEGGRDAVAAPS